MKVEQPKSAKPRTGVHRYWVCYQPKDDPFTHIRDFDNYDDAVELFNAIRVLHREFEIPVRINLTEFPNAPRDISGSMVLLNVNTVEGEKFENTP